MPARVEYLKVKEKSAEINVSLKKLTKTHNLCFLFYRFFLSLSMYLKLKIKHAIKWWISVSGRKSIHLSFTLSQNISSLNFEKSQNSINLRKKTFNLFKRISILCFYNNLCEHSSLFIKNLEKTAWFSCIIGQRLEFK